MCAFSRLQLLSVVEEGQRRQTRSLYRLQTAVGRTIPGMMTRLSHQERTTQEGRCRELRIDVGQPADSVGKKKGEDRALGGLDKGGSLTSHSQGQLLF